MASQSKEPLSVMRPSTEQSSDIMHMPTMTELRAALESGEVTSRELIQAYLARIEQVNGFVKAIAQVNPDAIADASACDQERAAGFSRGKLHGIPVLIKESMATLDKMETTGESSWSTLHMDLLPLTGRVTLAGSLALVGSRPSVEATAVRRLREAGAIILGKGTMSEWNYARSGNVPSGWSATSGQCVGPFYSDQDPQGSSSGCAVAASIGLAPATIAGEAWGSITYPSQNNGVVGLKPTVGLVSRAGAVGGSRHKDTIGSITRTVRDGAALLDAIAGKCPFDTATDSIPFTSMPDFESACRPDALRGAKIAVSQILLDSYSHRDVVEALEQALEVMEAAGAEVRRNADFEGWVPNKSIRDPMPGNVLLREGLESYFSSLAVNPHDITTLAGLIEFMKQTPGEETEKYGLDWLEAARNEPFSSTSKEFQGAMEEMIRQGNAIKKLLDDADCDALVMPTTGDAPYDLGQNPAVAVPIGFFPPEKAVSLTTSGKVSKGPNIPFSLTFLGRKWDDEKLIGLAYAFEQLTLVQSQSRHCVMPTREILTGRSSSRM